MSETTTTETKQNNEKKYLVLIEARRGEREIDEIRDWMICSSRQETYDYIKETLIALTDEGIEVDVDESSIVLVITEDDISSAATIREYMQYMKDTGKVIDETSFDIEEY